MLAGDHQTCRDRNRHVTLFSTLLRKQGLAQYAPDRLRLRRPRLRLLRDPGAQRLFFYAIEPQADRSADTGLRAATASFLAIRY
jgi:hypothetical protein